MKEVKDNRLVKKTIPLNSNKLSLILSYLSLYDKLTSLQVSFSFRSGSLIAISNYHILQDFSSITDISDNDFLENDSGLGSSNAIKLVERFKFKSFHVNRHYGNLIRYIMNTPINVSYLSVYELPSCNEVNLFGVSSIKSSVKEIDLSYEAMTSKNKQVYDDFITNFLNECFSLKVLKLKSFNMGEVTFPKLENFPDLESLSLEDVTLVSSSHQYDYLYRVKSLTKLAIVKVNPYTIKDHNKESICEHLFKLGKVLTNNKENLRELFLSGITVSYFLDLNHHFPKSIFNSCFSELESSITELQSLQSLSLSNIMLSSPGDVSRLLNSLPCLEKVVLNNIKYNSFFQNKEDIIQFLQKIFSIKDVSLDNNSVKTYFRFEEFNESLLKNALIDYNENQFKKATENTKPTSSKSIKYKSNEPMGSIFYFDILVNNDEKQKRRQDCMTYQAIKTVKEVNHLNVDLNVESKDLTITENTNSEEGDIEILPSIDLQENKICRRLPRESSREVAETTKNPYFFKELNNHEIQTLIQKNPLSVFEESNPKKMLFEENELTINRAISHLFLGKIPENTDFSLKLKVFKPKLKTNSNISNTSCILTLLIVDDEEMIRKSIIRLLTNYLEAKNREFQVIECCDGIEALYAIYYATSWNIHINAMISDETMNFINGSLSCFILDKLVDLNKVRDISIFISTAYGNAVDHGIFKKAKRVFSKPLNMSNIAEIVDTLIK